MNSVNSNSRGPGLREIQSGFGRDRVVYPDISKSWPARRIAGRPMILAKHNQPRCSHRFSSSIRSSVSAILQELRQREDFFAYPGPILLRDLEERIASNDAAGTLRLVQFITTALLSRSYRCSPTDWEGEEARKHRLWTSACRASATKRCVIVPISR